MDERQRSELTGIIPGRIKFDCPMGQMTTFQAGGNAEAVCFPGEVEALRQIISYLGKEGIAWTVAGKGSNLLIADGGIRGAVIILKDRLASVEKAGDEETLILAGGGLTIAGLLSYCSMHALSGLEFLAGIPGTLGGAVFMNAGAFGLETGELVEEILIIRGDGEPVVINRHDLNFSYRSSSVPGGAVIYGARLKLMTGEKGRISAMIAHYLKRKKETQPLDYPSGGSVFKNPPGDYAGRLIEKAGLKGERIGGAMISSKHGNFIVNTGGARAGDILALINLARERVKAETGIDLETEIVILGD